MLYADIGPILRGHSNQSTLLCGQTRSVRLSGTLLKETLICRQSSRVVQIPHKFIISLRTVSFRFRYKFALFFTVYPCTHLLR